MIDGTKAGKLWLHSPTSHWLMKTQASRKVYKHYTNTAAPKAKATLAKLSPEPFCDSSRKQ
jgi:hypothetical protein